MLTDTELKAELTMVMAGAAAELIATGELSTAAGADIERATELARSYAGYYGMAEGVGRIRVVQKETELFLGRDMLSEQHLSPHTLDAMDAAVRRLITEAEAAAGAILKRHRRTLDELADALAEHESLDEAEVRSYLEVPAPKPRNARVPARARA